MIFTTVDIETTGFNKQNNDIIQFAYMRTDEFGNFYGGETLFFYYPGTERSWSAEAEAVHGIPLSELRKHKDEFMTNCKKMWVVIYLSNAVTFNGDGFDLPFIKTWLERLGFPRPLEDKSFDVMKIYKSRGKGGKLTKLTESMGLTTDVVRAVTEEYFGTGDQAHTAHYDSVATWLLLRYAIAQRWVVIADPSANDKTETNTLLDDKPFYEDCKYFIKDSSDTIFEVALCPDRNKYAYYKREVVGVDDSKIPFKEKDIPGLYVCGTIAIRVTPETIKMGALEDV